MGNSNEVRLKGLLFRAISPPKLMAFDRSGRLLIEEDGEGFKSIGKYKVED